MKIISRVGPGASRLAKLQVEPSKRARQRLKWFDYYNSHGGNARLTCRYFGKCTTQLHPRWGKENLATILNERSYQVSASMVGRITHRLKERCVLKELISNHISARKRQRKRPYAIRKPKDYEVSRVGDLVQLDTLDIRPLPGVVLKHFTAHDVISRWNAVGVYHRATATTAAHFLDAPEKRMPFPVKATQVDGGSEFEAIFEEVCQRQGIKLFVLPPRLPKLNGGVERAHRTHTEEFYEVTESSFDIAELGNELLEWERIYNIACPHRALGYLTPSVFLEQQEHHQGNEVRCQTNVLSQYKALILP